MNSFQSLISICLGITRISFFLVSLRFEYFWNVLIPSPSFLYLFQIDKLAQILTHHYENNYFQLEFINLIFNLYFKTNSPYYFLQIFTKTFKPSFEYIHQSLKVMESITKLLVFLKKHDKNLCLNQEVTSYNFQDPSSRPTSKNFLRYLSFF